MSLYHIHLKDKFKDAKSVSLEEFLKYINKGLYSELTEVSTVFDVLMAALKLDYTIAYINEGVHSRSLQMWNRNNISDYVPPKINTMSIPSQIINNSLLNLSNIPVVQNDNIVSLQDQSQQQQPLNNNEHNSKKKKKKKKNKKKLNVSDVSDVSNVVINNNLINTIINNNSNPESDDVNFNLSPDDENTTDTEEILVSEKKHYKIEPVKDKRKIIEILNKTNNRNNKSVSG
jgi:hypothetical protein